MNHTLRENCPNVKFFWSVFASIRTEFGDLLRNSPCSARIRENTDQKNFVFGHFHTVTAHGSFNLSIFCENLP